MGGRAEVGTDDMDPPFQTWLRAPAGGYCLVVFAASAFLVPLLLLSKDVMGHETIQRWWRRASIEKESP